MYGFIKSLKSGMSSANYQYTVSFDIMEYNAPSPRVLLSSFQDGCGLKPLPQSNDSSPEFAL